MNSGIFPRMPHLLSLGYQHKSLNFSLLSCSAKYLAHFFYSCATVWRFHIWSLLPSFLLWWCLSPVAVVSLQQPVRQLNCSNFITLPSLFFTICGVFSFYDFYLKFLCWNIYFTIFLSSREFCSVFFSSYFLLLFCVITVFAVYLYSFYISHPTRLTCVPLVYYFHRTIYPHVSSRVSSSIPHTCHCGCRTLPAHRCGCLTFAQRYLPSCRYHRRRGHRGDATDAFGRPTASTLVHYAPLSMSANARGSLQTVSHSSADLLDVLALRWQFACAWICCSKAWSLLQLIVAMSTLLLCVSPVVDNNGSNTLQSS